MGFMAGGFWTNSCEYVFPGLGPPTLSLELRGQRPCFREIWFLPNLYESQPPGRGRNHHGKALGNQLLHLMELRSGTFLGKKKLSNLSLKIAV